ncbi:MAG: helix-turn-helix domain-containing protein [Christensenellales bacterium]|nr:helix-turn-helix domain-containing protein [Christensenellales bacterium]
MDEIQGKYVNLSLSKPDQLYRIAHALASPVRIRIMQALANRSMNVGELAETLDIPMSTTALAVKTLEEAFLISTETQPGARGAMKLCSRRLDKLSIQLVPEETENNVLAQMLPIGGYSKAEGILPTCGLASEKMVMGEMDLPAMFYSPDRFHTQLLWFRQGALEYRFSFAHMDQMEIDWLELSFEACSEAPMYRDPWKSDIVVSINEKRLGVWTCPCDCGGRHGKLTPSWWPALSTQYGFLKTWRVSEEGTYLDGVRLSGVTISDLRLGKEPCIRIRIEVPGDAQNVGGINLFGEFFGDYPQAIMIRAGYRLKPHCEKGPNYLE